ncbi:MAG: iron-containing alcohol dehydrogenase [Planctomycetaceae bacterium]|nr:iron-containing alcohol dehydrogenase [Planctomycetaceae bacterium]
MQLNPPGQTTNPASSELSTELTFDWQPRTRVVCGAGRVAQLGELARELGGTRVLLVTDPGLARTGHPQRARQLLEQAGLHVALHDDVEPNPTTVDVDRALLVARREKVDLIVGFGGGSSMDCAKGVNFLLTSGGRMEDYHGVGKAKAPMLPMIAVPTTAGTGSEAQSFALIARADSHMKMACGDPKAACRVAILDPELTVSMPQPVTAVTGIDAISHALETSVTRPRNGISLMYSRQAWGLLSRAFPVVLREPKNLQARGEMLLGAHLAGAAIENSMLGATHALANPLSAHFGTTHGVAVGVMLPHVIRFNATVAGAQYGLLAADAGLCRADDPEAPARLADYVESLVSEAGLPTTLSACQVDSGLFPQLAEEAAAQWTGTFNPRPVDSDSLRGLYECAMSARRAAG